MEGLLRKLHLGGASKTPEVQSSVPLALEHHVDLPKTPSDTDLSPFKKPTPETPHIVQSVADGQSAPVPEAIGVRQDVVSAARSEPHLATAAKGEGHDDLAALRATLANAGAENMHSVDPVATSAVVLEETDKKPAHDENSSGTGRKIATAALGLAGVAAPFATDVATPPPAAVLEIQGGHELVLPGAVAHFTVDGETIEGSPASLGKRLSEITLSSGATIMFDAEPGSVLDGSRSDAEVRTYVKVGGGADAVDAETAWVEVDTAEIGETVKAGDSDAAIVEQVPKKWKDKVKSALREKGTRLTGVFHRNATTVITGESVHGQVDPDAMIEFTVDPTKAESVARVEPHPEVPAPQVSEPAETSNPTTEITKTPDLEAAALDGHPLSETADVQGAPDDPNPHVAETGIVAKTASEEDMKKAQEVAANSPVPTIITESGAVITETPASITKPDIEVPQEPAKAESASSTSELPAAGSPSEQTLQPGLTLVGSDSSLMLAGRANQIADSIEKNVANTEGGSDSEHAPALSRPNGEPYPKQYSSGSFLKKLDINTNDKAAMERAYFKWMRSDKEGRSYAKNTVEEITRILTTDEDEDELQKAA